MVSEGTALSFARMAARQRSVPPVALVTGASRRVGRAIALELAARGCEVWVTYRSAKREALSLLKEIGTIEGATPGGAIRADFSNAERAARMIVAAFGRRPLDVLVHNASMYEPDRARPRAQAAAAREHFEVNALAPMLLSDALSSRLAKSSLPGGGAIIFMGDIHATGRPRRRWTGYLASKAAAHQVAEVLALRLAPAIRVNVVAPGMVAAPPSLPAAERNHYVARVPLGRSGTPRDAAGAVAWLALDAPYITGATIRVDGGRWLT